MALESPQHISLQLGERELLLRRSLYSTLLTAVIDSAPKQGSSVPVRVLDVGSGRGELLRLLAQRGFIPTGLDLEPRCVEAGSLYGHCWLGNIQDIPRLFNPGDFDVIVCSHVLEHLREPFAALQILRRLNARAYILAVPNPLRCARMIRAIANSRRSDHEKHISAWGHPEFHSFLHASGFEVISWYADRVTVNPFGGTLGAVLTKLMYYLESRFLPKLFPMLTSSIIVSCRIDNSAEIE